MNMRYKADITAGSLKLPESRVVAGLLLQGVTDSQWQSALYHDNVLQARTTETAKRLGRLIRSRLETMDEQLWRFVRDGSRIVATHACLAAAVKHSPLLGDFLDIVVRDQYRVFGTHLSASLWEDYVESCMARDPDLPEWSSSTVARLRSSVFQILAQAGYIEDTRTLRLQTNYIAEEVLSYLHDRDERYVLCCIQVNP